MAWIVIVLGALLVIGPVFWMMPSERDRQLERLRGAARSHGLDVVDVELPQTRRERVREEERRRGVLYRASVPLTRARSTPTVRWVRERPDAPWEPEGGELPVALVGAVERVLGALPPAVKAFELGRQGPGIYWREQGNEATVAALAALLKPLADQIGGETQATD